MLYEDANGFLATGRRFVIGVLHRFCAYIDDGALTLLLPVVNPPDDGNHTVHKTAVVHAVLTMEVDGLRVNVAEHVVRVHGGVPVAEETVNTLAVGIVDILEALLGLFPILLDKCLVYVELLHAVLTGILELLCASHAVRLHGLAHFQGRIDTDAVESSQLFSIHAAHGCPQNEVGMLCCAELAQQGDGFLRMDRQVGGYDACLREYGAEAADGA